MVWQSRPGLMDPPGPSWANPLPDVRAARPISSAKLPTPNVALRRFVMELASWLFHAAHFLPLFAIWQPAIRREGFRCRISLRASGTVEHVSEYQRRCRDLRGILCFA